MNNAEKDIAKQILDVINASRSETAFNDQAIRYEVDLAKSGELLVIQDYRYENYTKVYKVTVTEVL